MNRDVTLVLTSCGRYDLLARTLQSLYTFNSHPFKEVIVVEDGVGGRVGQVEAIDYAYARVKTPYIFHCEDDWEFTRCGFIEHSLDVLERFPLALQVWLRAHDDTNGHPLVMLPEFSGYRTLSTDHYWKGFSWNPGLRRMSDYLRLGSYSAHKLDTNAHTEQRVGEIYASWGYHAVILNRCHVRHLGAGRSVLEVL